MNPEKTAGLPYGRYVLAAHVKAGETLKERMIQADNPQTIDFALSAHR